MSSKYYDYKPGMTIDGIIVSWASEGRKMYDEITHASFPAKELWPYREYTWTRDSASGNQVTSNKGKAYTDKWAMIADRDDNIGGDKWDAMVATFKSSGWSRTDPLLFMVGKNGKGKVGEGNHRLAIAKELGIEVPVRFVFVYEVELDSASNR